jgi:hypothetical protein
MRLKAGDMKRNAEVGRFPKSSENLCQRITKGRAFGNLYLEAGTVPGRSKNTFYFS